MPWDRDEAVSPKQDVHEEDLKTSLLQKQNSPPRTSVNYMEEKCVCISSHLLREPTRRHLGWDEIKKENLMPDRTNRHPRVCL